jgi:hypothetical protein
VGSTVVAAPERGDGRGIQRGPLGAVSGGGGSRMAARTWVVGRFLHLEEGEQQGISRGRTAARAVQQLDFE